MLRSRKMWKARVSYMINDGRGASVESKNLKWCGWRKVFPVSAAAVHSMESWIGMRRLNVKNDMNVTAHHFRAKTTWTEMWGMWEVRLAKALMMSRHIGYIETNTSTASIPTSNFQEASHYFNNNLKLFLGLFRLSRSFKIDVPDIDEPGSPRRHQLTSIPRSLCGLCMTCRTASAAWVRSANNVNPHGLTWAPSI